MPGAVWPLNNRLHFTYIEQQVYIGCVQNWIIRVIFQWILFFTELGKVLSMQCFNTHRCKGEINYSWKNIIIWVCCLWTFPQFSGKYLVDIAGHWTLLLIVKDQSSYLVYLNIMHTIKHCENLSSVDRRKREITMTLKNKIFHSK